MPVEKISPPTLSKANMKPAEQFGAIVEEHYQPLFRFALSLTRAESDAWDLTQQAFYVLVAKGHQLRDLSNVKSWLFTTLHRAYLHTRRRQAPFVDQELEEVSKTLPIDSPESGTQMDACQVLSALGQLDEVYQAPVSIFYLQDYSYREIAGILEVPVGTVKSRISRGIGLLNKILLSDDHNTGCLAPNETTSKVAADEADAWREKASFPLSCDRETAGSSDRGCAEWDFRPTRRGGTVRPHMRLTVSLGTVSQNHESNHYV